MSRETQDPERVPENIDPARQITTSYHCPACGYDLRYATLVGRCSQCGSVYNARSQGPSGIASLKTAPVAPTDEDLPPGVSPDRHITKSLFCDQCGYSLRYATLAGRCSECGNPYNTRSVLTTGIFLPTSVRVPTWEILVGVILLLFGYSLIRSGLSPLTLWKLVMGGIALALCIACAASAISAFRHLIRFRPVLRQIRGCEDDDD